MVRMGFEIKKDKFDADLNKAEREILRKLKSGMFLVANELLSNAVKECPVDKGRLRGSLTLKKISDFIYKVYTNVEYASPVEFGTGIYGEFHRPIKAKKKAMVFKLKSGEIIFVRQILGQKPNPFMLRAVNLTKPKATGIINKVLK